MQKYFSILLLIPFFVVTSGCSDGKLKTYPVSGIVTLNGEPVPEATIVFAPVKEGVGDAATGRTNDKGEYKLQTANGRVDGGTTPGEYGVVIKKDVFVGTGKVTTDSSGLSSEEMRSVSQLPAKYGSYSSPMFKETVEAKKNVFNFNLED